MLEWFRRIVLKVFFFKLKSNVFWFFSKDVFFLRIHLSLLPSSIFQQKIDSHFYITFDFFKVCMKIYGANNEKLLSSPYFMKYLLKKSRTIISSKCLLIETLWARIFFVIWYNFLFVSGLNYLAHVYEICPCLNLHFDNVVIKIDMKNIRYISYWFKWLSLITTEWFQRKYNLMVLIYKLNIRVT